MPLRLHNTLTRAIDPFIPLQPGRASLYTCGPTVYNYAHIGNFRTFLFEDLLRRWLEASGYDVFHVMNLTDVDDKTIKGAGAAGVPLREHTEKFARAFFEDRDYLRILPAHAYPKATEFVAPMVALVESLLRKGVAYKGEDGSVYFAIARFPTYGRLSHLDVRSIRPGARVAADDYNKEDVRDFALWKAAKPEDEASGAAWDSPWGRGRPGWHLECSAMAKRYLGDTLDIHAGGADLIFPHHEDEIAQSEGANGVLFSRFWCHGEFLLTEGVKMAKRLGNVANIQGLREAGISAAAIRHFIFSVHYRKQLNLTEEALDASQAAVRRVGAFAERLARATGGTPGLVEAAEQLERDATAALFDDLNAPEAMGALFEFIRRANAELDAAAGVGGEGGDSGALARARSAFELVNGVLDVVPDEAAVSDELGAWVEERISARGAARRQRDFSAADAIRRELEERGIAIEDTPQGTRWKKVP